jgi:hypothetical protein
MKIFIISTPQQILFGGQSQNGKERPGHMACMREKKCIQGFGKKT